MSDYLFNEQWKTIVFDFDYTNDFRMEVSNYGRLRNFNKISQGHIVKGSMINGYKIIRLKLYSPRQKEIQDRFDYLKQQSVSLAQKLKRLKTEMADESLISETEQLLATFKKNLSKKFQDDLKKRTINYHSLIHRLVAVYFLQKPTEGQTVVAHLDFNKLNNRASNLKWMTPEENYEHAKNSPLVKEAKRMRTSRGTKLTVTKVMLMKKLLNEGKPVKQLVKLFKVTDTQIIRIKRGENWADVPAAK